MKKLLIILSSISSIALATDISTFINKNNCNQILDKNIYQVCYDYGYKGAKYVAYTVDSAKLNAGENIKKRPPFYAENDIPIKYRSYPDDYTHSGYDRGHMANHADFDYSAVAVYQTYSMANIVPQAPVVNRETWIKAEKYERVTAQQLGSVSVINGVAYGTNPPRIGKDYVAVPAGMWKMVYNDKAGFKKCFWYDNDLNANGSNDKLRDHEIKCDKLQ